MNQLYFGDNLQVLRDHLATESVDLIYLDHRPDLNFKKAKAEANAQQPGLKI